MVDVDFVTCFGSTDEVDDLICVGAVESTGKNEAAVEDDVGEVAVEDDVSGIAAVDVTPTGTKFGAGVACAWSAAFDF